MALGDIERLHYYPRQYLGSADMEDQQAYLRDMRRRHNVAPHTWGIVVGLELEQRPRLGSPDEVDVYVKPGLAIDGFGREIVVLAPYQLNTVDFAVFGTKRYVDVWIAYDEELRKQVGPGYEQCVGTTQFTRVRETFRIVPAPDPPTHDAITVDGQAATRRADVDPANPPAVIIPDDESVPYQELPLETDDPRWLVRLGSVQWDGTRNPPAFVKDTANRLLEARHYAGLVSAHLLAPAAGLTVRDRSTPTPLPNDDKVTGATVVVEGALQVDRLLTAKRDVQLHGGKIDLRDGGGANGGAPFLVYRSLTQNTDGGNDLRVALGTAGDGKHHFVVGPEKGGSLDVKFGVRDNGDVHLNGKIFVKDQARFEAGLSIKGVVDFDDVLGDRLMMWGDAAQAASYGFGIESGTLYARAGTRHRWYVGKTADDGASAIVEVDASGLRVTKTLAVQGVLDFDEVIGDRLMLWGPANAGNAFGLGIEFGTLYARANSFHRWYVGTNRDDGVSDRMELGAAGLTIKGSLSVAQNVTVSGNLTVLGSQNIIRIEQRTFALSNAGNNTPRTWSWSYAGMFAQTPVVFAVFQGFSLWGYDGITSFTPNSANHGASADDIPQHAFVRVTSVGLNSAAGECYCSESDVTWEADNTILFTVIALGRSA